MHPFGSFLVAKDIMDDRHHEAERDRRSLAARPDAPPEPIPDPRRRIPRAPVYRRIGPAIRRLVMGGGHA